MKLPKEVLIYAIDYDKSEPIFAVAKNVNDIPEDCHGEKVGIYVFNRTSTFKVKKGLD